MIVLIWLWALVLNWIAYKKTFYTLPKIPVKSTPHVSFKELLIAFGIYLVLSLLILPIFARLLLQFLHKMNPDITSLPITLLTGMQFVTMLGVFLVLFSYFNGHAPDTLKKIWKNRERPPNAPIEQDLTIGLVAWFLSFPIVTIISEVTDNLMKAFFHLKDYEQAAVKFVKAAMSQPASLVFALFSILFLAPLVEEFLFRGVLQTYFKKRMGFKAALLISALAFALFHYSPSQGLGNVSLMVSLFILGGFLGFIYERQGSLWSPIALHMTFNAISALRIVFLPEALS